MADSRLSRTEAIRTMNITTKLMRGVFLALAVLFTAPLAATGLPGAIGTAYAQNRDPLIAAVLFEGNQGFSDAQLITMVDVATRGVANPAVIAADAESIRLAYEGKGDFCAGEHCRFCRARYTCRVRSEYHMRLAKQDFKEPNGSMWRGSFLGFLVGTAPGAGARAPVRCPRSCSRRRARPRQPPARDALRPKGPTDGYRPRTGR